MSSEPASAPAAVGDRRSHGRRFVVCWLVLRAIITPLVLVFGPRMPPGDATVQSSEQVFDNTVLVSVVTPVFVFVVLFVVYALAAFRVGREELRDGPPERGSRRIQVLWVVVTSVVMCGLGAFGSYELVKDGGGGGQGASAAFLPAGRAHALSVQVI